MTLSGWDAASTSNHHFILQTLDEYTFGVRRGKSRKIFRKKGLPALREWVFSPSTGPMKVRQSYENTRLIRSSTLLIYPHPYTLNKRFIGVKFSSSTYSS